MFASVAHAMGSAGAGAAGNENVLMNILPLIILMVLFYFLLIRPQQKRAKEHRAMLDALKKGDRVLTSGGLLGRVTAISGDEVSVDLGSTEVTVSRSYVTGVVDNKIKKEEK